MGCYGYGVRCARSKVAAFTLALGLAGAADAQEQVDILALGDSLTQGYGLIEQEGFVPQLRAWLDDRGHDVRVVNAGVSGDTSAGGLARVEWSLTPEIDAMIVALGGNDVLRGLDPGETRRNIDGILQVAQDNDVEVLLIGLTAPGNYGADYRRAFDALFADLAAQYDTVFLPSFFAGIEAVTDSTAAMRQYMQSDGIHPDAEGVELIVDAVGPKVEALIDRVD